MGINQYWYKFSTGVLNEPNNDKNSCQFKKNDRNFREVTLKINVDFELEIRLWYYEAENGWENYTGKIREAVNDQLPKPLA